MEIEVVSLKMVREDCIFAHDAISEPTDVVQLWRALHPQEPDREELWLICLDACMRPTKVTMVSRGSLDRAIATPREVFKAAILANAKYIILVHNHPSGIPHPGEDDRWISELIWNAGEILGIPLRDHVIVGDGCYYSATSERKWETPGYPVSEAQESELCAEGEKCADDRG